MKGKTFLNMHDKILINLNYSLKVYIHESLNYLRIKPYKYIRCSIVIKIWLSISN